MTSLGKKLAAEFLGTFAFVLVGAGSAVAARFFGTGDQVSLLIAALANGLGLAVAISATMAVSGGALNPAVTLGLYVGKKLPGRDVLPYMIAEVAGALLAGLALVVSLPSSLGNPVVWGAPTLSSTLTTTQGTLLELLMTLFLVFAVFGTAVDPRAPKIGGFGIGIAGVADVLLGGPFTGAAMNPARAIGPMLAAGFLPSYWYIYWLGPLAGGVIAALAYRFALSDGS